MIGVKYVVMRGYSHKRRAEETGRWLGTLLRRLIFRNGPITRLGGKSLAVRVVLWATGIVVVGLLLLFAVWISLLAMFAWGAIKLLPHVSRSRDSDDSEWKWRQGLLGFGLYSHSGFRLDSDDPGPDA